ncbi:MAG: hypothetical protein HYX67_12945, partial [Candidatus Melainabacteria bacterium]|nr:hypothetical protein [Candidatus Melainabacteria bacterium]
MRYLFELSIALKYLIPRKKQLSVSLISLLSVGVISLVVWLVLVFLSVTEGIERGWLNKLTSLNAPLRLTPTEHYYSSYYYQIDAVSEKSQYASKSIGEKALAAKADPYDAVEDGELPVHFPQADLGDKGALKDPVKGLYQVLSALKKSRSDLVFQDFELSGALMRLQMLRPGVGIQGDSQNYLTQVSYLASVPDKSPQFSTLVLPPSAKDLNHLFYLAAHTTEMSRQDTPALTMKTSKEVAHQRIRSLLDQSTIKELTSRYTFWQLPPTLLPDNKHFVGEAQYRNGKLHRIDLPLMETGLKAAKNRITVWKEGGQLIMEDGQGKKERLSLHTPLLVDSKIRLDVTGSTLADTLLFQVQSKL